MVELEIVDFVLNNGSKCCVNVCGVFGFLLFQLFISFCECQKRSKDRFNQIQAVISFFDIWLSASISCFDR
jgi:hypothetical protein